MVEAEDRQIDEIEFPADEEELVAEPQNRAEPALRIEDTQAGNVRDDAGDGALIEQVEQFVGIELPVGVLVIPIQFDLPANTAFNRDTKERNPFTIVEAQSDKALEHQAELVDVLAALLVTEIEAVEEVAGFDQPPRIETDAQNPHTH